MAPPFPDLVRDLTREEIRDDLIQLAQDAGLDITTWEPGEPIWALIDVFSNWIARVWNMLVVPALRSRFLEYATGKWLDILAWTAYNRIRLQKTTASGSLVVENRGPTFVSITPGTIRVKNTDNKTFRNVTGGTIAAFTGGGTYPTTSSPLVFVADEAGTESSTPIGGIITTPIMSPAAGVRVQTNTAAWIGTDLETDPLLKERCNTATAPLSPAGPIAAYLAVARDPKGTLERAELPTEGYPETVAITRANVIELNGSLVHVYLASSSGPAAGSDISAGTDIFFANSVIQLLVVPAGVTALVAPALALPIDYGTITLYVRRASRVTEAEAVAAATSSFAEFFSTLPIGGVSKTPNGQGYVFADHVKAVLQAGAGVFTVTLQHFNATDITIEKYEVAVPTYTLIQAIIV